MKRIAILGSTGSIGSNALRVIEANPSEYKAVALAAGRNVDLLQEQIEKYQPLCAALLEEEPAERLRERLGSRSKTRIFSGTDGFLHVSTMPEVDTVISAMTGASGLLPTYAALTAGKQMALANKETMVMAGQIVMAQAASQQVAILPIDSEHSAILQSLQGHPKEDVKRIILTASGGPFREASLAHLEKVTPEEALQHPTWTMGRKITIDSATLMNKGLEAIEAKWLFDLPIDQISILIHPQSIVHSMVEYRDGSVIAQLGVPSMITPISYALSFPKHLKTPLPSLKLEEIGMLTFSKPDLKKFKCLELALRSVEIGHSMPAVLNGANEVAVESFLQGEIGFLQIPELIEKTMEAHTPFAMDGIEGVLEADAWARDEANTLKRHLRTH
ncbi:MAG: 1-deoxy-D-xylulose-5-phosphate reductoisomerase [Deltaproteobacteria bacterium]|nr:1-deoxy-D-xylulose-5-phosphate reductoisomerase [Deltaproteobacteria bacterium]MBW1941355.1 1-deoxy-D-xylulose-5-phosphate reductoisomerase [Deltaproteobacteria bacterium]MBW2205346.1 1-deoxy-D-xylulose-5-phosphate reductoisomerase [Deltaproteobacteria bacterium]